MDNERRLICKAGLALVATAAAGCGTTAKSDEDMGPFECGVNAVGAGDVPASGAAVKQMLATTNVFICRDGNGVYAMDAGCTHLGCDVAPNDAADVTKGFKCPCHGATYDGNGQNPTTPAPKPLTHYQVCELPSGSLVVDPTMTVDAATRLKV